MLPSTLLTSCISRTRESAEQAAARPALGGGGQEAIVCAIRQQHSPIKVGGGVQRGRLAVRLLQNNLVQRVILNIFKYFLMYD